MPSLTAVLRPSSTRQCPDEPPSHDTTEAQGRLTPQPHARISSDIRPCFLFLVHPIAPSASDEPFFFFPSAPRTRKRPPCAALLRVHCSPPPEAEHAPPKAPPQIGHRARALPHAQSKIGHPRTRSPKSSPKTAHIRLLETPQNHPFARPKKAASVNSYSKPTISYNAPPKVLPRRAR